MFVSSCFRDAGRPDWNRRGRSIRTTPFGFGDASPGALIFADHKAQGFCVHSQIEPVFKAGLVHDVLQVPPHGVDGDAELVGNLLVGKAACQLPGSRIVLSVSAIKEA